MQTSFFTAAILLGFAVVWSASLSTAHRVERNIDCLNSIFRLSTRLDKSYVITCTCSNSDEFLGRAVSPLPDNVRNTAAQARVTLRCLRSKKAFLEHRCEHGALEYERAARHVLQRCISKPVPKKNRLPERPFTFRRDMCEAELRLVDGRSPTGSDQFEAFVVCACRQAKDYIVHPGAVRLITQGSPLGARREARFLASCTRASLSNLGSTCRSSARRFDLRAAQTFNVCCKRARVMFPNSKLDCQTVVPDDVDSIQLRPMN